MREERQVPDATFRSYYGQPVVRAPVWATFDIAGYLFLGGLAGGSSLLAAGAHAVGQPTVSQRAKLTAAASAVVSLGLLVHDLGRPARFLNMLRVFKPTSPMNVGSWLLAAYAPAALAAAGASMSGRAPRIGVTATTTAAVLAPFVASYTGVLISDTAVPAWHDGADEMPVAFVGSSAMAAGGMSLLLSGVSGTSAARRFAVAGAVVELVALERMRHRLGIVAETYRRGPQQWLLRAGRTLAISGAIATVALRRNDAACRVAGACLVAASVATRFGIFGAGVDSANDPRFTIEPQRTRATGHSIERSGENDNTPGL